MDASNIIDASTLTLPTFGRFKSDTQRGLTLWKSAEAAAAVAAELEAGTDDGWTYRVAVNGIGRFLVAIFDEENFFVGYYQHI